MAVAYGAAVHPRLPWHAHRFPRRTTRMIDTALIEELPRFERMTTMTDKRRENRKQITSRLRSSWCAKQPFSRKQALTARSTHLKFGRAEFLRIYKCPKKACGAWHLTHKPERRSFPQR